MTNLEWLKKIRNNFEDNPTPFMVKYRMMKGIEIIAEELCKFNAREESKHGGWQDEQRHDNTS